MGNHFRERESFGLIGRRAVLKGIVTGAATGASVTASASKETLDLQHWLDTADPVSVAEYHIAALRTVMERIDTGRIYRSKVDYKIGCVFIVGDDCKLERPA